MEFYNVQVNDEKFKVEASSVANASRLGRNHWRDNHREKNKDESFRIPEPLTVVVTLVGTSIPTI